MILPVLGDYYLDALVPEDALQWFEGAAAGKAASTANGYLRVFKVLMADAVAQYRLSRESRSEAAGCSGARRGGAEQR